MWHVNKLLNTTLSGDACQTLGPFHMYTIKSVIPARTEYHEYAKQDKLYFV